MFNINKAKTLFFDTKKVESMIGKDAARALSRAGAFVQRRMRSSMRRRKGPSKPGQPPSAHDGSKGPLLKELLFFALDPSTGSVVVGPAPLGKAEAPGLNERGGTVIRKKWIARTRQKATTKRQAASARARYLDGRLTSKPSDAQQVSYPATYPKRAFAGPALEAEVAAGNVTGAFAGPGT